MIKISKKLLIGIGIAGVALATILGILIFSLQKREKIPKEGKEVQKEKTIEEILRDLTPENVEPLSEKEQKELEETLQKLTPSNAEPMSPEKVKETEELLEKLTPK